MVLYRLEKTGVLFNIDIDKNVIGEGGEGRIYGKIRELPNQVVKIYRKVTSEKIEKLKVMVVNPPKDPMAKKGHVSIAWPQDLVIKHDTGEYVGFSMPEIPDMIKIFNVYIPQERKEKAPWFNWLLLHITAQNLASAIQNIHDKNYVVGDIKPDNILVHPQGIVCIVDTDSFQIKDPKTGKIYRCPVVSSEYIPPEIYSQNQSVQKIDTSTNYNNYRSQSCPVTSFSYSQSQKLKDIDRSEVHDRFALGVIIYHLLFGSHPYEEGTWNREGEPPTTDECIKKGYWLHAPKSPFSTTIFSIPLEIVHPEIQSCFHRCFTEGNNNPELRPSAREWREALDTAIIDLTDCEIEVGHQYAKSYGKCYWCERKNIGIDTFPTVSEHSKCNVAAVRALLENQNSPKPKVLSNQDLNKQTVTGVDNVPGIHNYSSQQVQSQNSPKPNVLNNQHLNEQTVTAIDNVPVIHNYSSQQVQSQNSPKPNVLNNQHLNEQTVTSIDNNDSQQIDINNEYSKHNSVIQNNNYQKPQVKQSSPVTTWISVIFIIIFSLIAVPQLRESVTIPILRTLTGTNK